MNFLSHFYFERYDPDHHLVIGIVLPDFVKNADKDWNLSPHKEGHLFLDNPGEVSILKGWNRHLEVDKLFHCSSFFMNETAELKKLIMPALQYGPVKPFFLAHIALELMLDHLLVVQNKVNIHQFYDRLHLANNSTLQSFLHKAGIDDMNIFLRFLNGFISSKYLLSYQKVENITYALNRICMRLWDNPFTEDQLQLLTDGLMAYKNRIEIRYMEIFNEIENKLRSPLPTC